jgi:hypothetical protein
MLYCAPGQMPTSSIVRVPSTGEIFLVGTPHQDSIQNTAYRAVLSVHSSAGSATVVRKIPAVTLGIKGWAVDTLIRNTFADVELRSVNESQQATLLNYGNYFLFMPHDEPLQRHDVVTLNAISYYVLEVYKDSGFTSARVTAHPDERVNFTYTSVGAQTYNTSTQTVTSSNTTYNVTGKIVPEISQEIVNSEVITEALKVMLLDSFISFVPKVGDLINYLNKTYTVFKVERNSILSEWNLEASL